MVLRLDDDDDDDDGNGDNSDHGDGEVSGIHSGAGLRRQKRPLAVGRSGDHPVSGDSGKRGKLSPSPRARPLPSLQATAQSSETKGAASWLALRRALHERYRDSEEHRAAEHTAADASERGWGLGGSGSKGGNGGWGGEVMSPGLRCVKMLVAWDMLSHWVSHKTCLNVCVVFYIVQN